MESDKKPRAQIKETSCSKCGQNLVLTITAVKTGIPDHWVIGQCHSCEEFNLLTTGRDAGGIRFDNFVSLDVLDCTITTRREVMDRLLQMKSGSASSDK